MKHDEDSIEDALDAAFRRVIGHAPVVPRYKATPGPRRRNPKVMGPRAQQIDGMAKRGMSYGEVAEELRVTYSTVYEIARRHGIKFKLAKRGRKPKWSE